MADAPGCSKRSITTIRTKLRLFGDIRTPPSPGGPTRMISPVMLEDLYEMLLEEPELYLDKIADYRINTPNTSNAPRAEGYLNSTLPC